MSQNWILAPACFRFIIVILLILGIFFRFVNLDQKVYWQDEAVTSLRISGSSWSEVKQEFNGNEIGIDNLQKHLRVDPEKSVIDVLTSTAKEEPQISPLYYVMAHFWVQCWGDSVAATRSFSAFISLLVFPCIYWLCLELFESSLTGWVAVALLAVSPFHVLYAQEARMYSVWTLTIVLSNLALLRAIRLKTKLNWIIYTITLALALYSYLFSGLVAAGHGIYVIVTERFRFSKTLFYYSIASVTGFLCFMPWLLILFIKLSSARNTTKWSLEKIDGFRLIKVYTWNLISVFFNLNKIYKELELNNKIDGIVIYLITLVIFILILYSIYFIVNHTRRKAWLLVLILTGGTLLVIVIPSFILGTKLASVARYQIPCYLGIQLAVAYLLATQLGSLNLSQQKSWQVIFALVITCGVVSCVISSQAEMWWNKGDGYANLQVARIINQVKRPLLISNYGGINTNNLLSLSYLLEPKVRLKLVVDSKIRKIPNNFSNIFLFNPSKELQKRIETEQKYKVESVKPENLQLWKLIKE